MTHPLGQYRKSYFTQIEIFHRVTELKENCCLLSPPLTNDFLLRMVLLGWNFQGWVILVRYASGENFSSIGRTRPDSQLIHGQFWSSGELIKPHRNTRYRARGGFKLKLMSGRNFCPNRIFKFRIAHFLWAF
jgi:hypothetical protein